MRDAEACAAAVERIVERCGRIDVLVNNAGVVRDNLLGMLEDDDVRDGARHQCRRRVQRDARGGAAHDLPARRAIINLSSVAGEKGGRGQTNYAASKGAINAFTRALAVELAPRRITVNAVAPGRDRDRDVAGGARARRRRRSRRASCCAASARPRTSPTRSGSSPRALPTTSPARCCTSMAASRWSETRMTQQQHQPGRNRSRCFPRSRRSSPTRSAATSRT